MYLPRLPSKIAIFRYPFLSSSTFSQTFHANKPAFPREFLATPDRILQSPSSHDDSQCNLESRARGVALSRESEKLRASRRRMDARDEVVFFLLLVALGMRALNSENLNARYNAMGSMMMQRLMA